MAVPGATSTTTTSVTLPPRRNTVRRSQILESAVDAFGTKGFYQASLAEVAGSVGLTAAGLLHHFKTKEALLTELLALRDEADLAEACNPDRPRGLAFLRLLVDTVAFNMRRHTMTQLYAVLSAEAVTDHHPAQEWFRDRYVRVRAVLVEALAEAAAAGEIDATIDVEETAQAIVAVMDGLQIQWLYAPDDVDMAAVTERVISALVDPSRPLA